MYREKSWIISWISSIKNFPDFFFCLTVILWNAYESSSEESLRFSTSWRLFNILRIISGPVPFASRFRWTFNNLSASARCILTKTTTKKTKLERAECQMERKLEVRINEFFFFLLWIFFFTSSLSSRSFFPFLSSRYIIIKMNTNSVMLKYIIKFVLYKRPFALLIFCYKNSNHTLWKISNWKWMNQKILIILFISTTILIDSTRTF